MAAKTKGKESRQEEGQEQDPVAREITAWTFLSLPQISALSEQNIEGVQKKLEEFLNFRQIKTSLKEAVLLDYYVSGFWWAKEMDFTHLQLSGFMAILDFLLENLSTKHITLEDNIKELGRAMAGIGESHSEKSGGLDFFSVDQAKAIISYLKISLFQHYKLYEYLFHKPREELVIGDEGWNIIAAEKDWLVKHILLSAVIKLTNSPVQVSAQIAFLGGRGGEGEALQIEDHYREVSLAAEEQLLRV